MPSDNFVKSLQETLTQIHKDGTAKGQEQVVTAIIKGSGEFGPRFQLDRYELAFMRIKLRPSYLSN